MHFGKIISKDTYFGNVERLKFLEPGILWKFRIRSYKVLKTELVISNEFFVR